MSARIAPADILIVHAKVYTLNQQAPWAQALAIRRGKIVAVGSDEVVGRMRGIGTRVIDAGGKLVLPGFTDCHVHFLSGSLGLARVNLEGASNTADIQNRLREYAANHPGDSWILGRGWNYAMFAPATLPDRQALDQLFPNRPVLLTRVRRPHRLGQFQSPLSRRHLKRYCGPSEWRDRPRPANWRSNRRAQRIRAAPRLQNHPEAFSRRQTHGLPRRHPMG